MRKYLSLTANWADILMLGSLTIACALRVHIAVDAPHSFYDRLGYSMR